MVEIAISVAAKVVEFLVGPIARPFSYIWNYKINFDILEIEVRKLEYQRDAVQHSVYEARRNGEQIEQHVSDWMDRVKTMTDEVSEVIEENQRANMKCFKGLCLNPKKHYQHSRKAVKKANAIVGLCADGNFQTVSFRTIPETWIPSYKGYMVFESRMSTLKNILDALSNPDVNMVGIYGTGGVGKTTLAREICKQTEDKKLFNVVAFAEVAVKQDIKEIQKEIADKLGLTFTSEESVSGRARRLQQRLKQEEKVLLVLDNIWERLNLEDVGIPFGNDHKGCKLLLTARNLDVLSKMDSQRNFEVGFLDEGEAWSLFEKNAGSCDHLQALAKKVAEACGGLPIAIDSVAVALKTKEEFEWKDALRKLTTPSSSNFEGVAAETYSSIEISYSQLKERELKSTFLLCCIMEYTNVEDLLGYGMGLGIFEYVKAMEDTRNRVNKLVQKLRYFSLLLYINNNKISLHDVVRDVGRSIASRDGHMFCVMNNYIPREWVDKDNLKNCVGISLHNISKLPEEFECPELQFFYLRTTSTDYCQVPDNFFAGMPKLKVLHMAGLELYLVPNSIRLLVNLWTLYIDNCNLRDIDFIGEFKQLKILRIGRFYGSKIEMIPKKMCNLTGLRLLDLNDCCNLRNIPPNVLSTFTQLEELYLPTMEWEVEWVNILDELKHLKHLTALKISIPDDSVLPKGRLVSNKLERYNITIGNCKWNGIHGQASRIVKLNLESSSCCDEVQKFFSLLDREGFPELGHLFVENSPCFRTVADCLESESCLHFLFLQSLSLHSVLNLEMIHNYPLKADSFRQLTTIAVQFCHKLKNILSFSTYRALPLLQKVDVSTCNNMEEIFAIGREKDINNIEGTDQIEFKHLSSLTLKYLPKLTSFCSINNNKDMFDTPTLLFNQKNPSSSFRNLTSLEVKHCNSLINIGTYTVAKSLVQLTEMNISSCKKITEVIGNHVDVTEDEIIFRKLKRLILRDLPSLTGFCSWNFSLQFPSLETLTVQKCPNMKFFSQGALSTPRLHKLQITKTEDGGFWEVDLNTTVHNMFKEMVGFRGIENLTLSKFPYLKEVWHNQFPVSIFGNLKSLVVDNDCSSLRYIPSVALDLVQLQELKITNCGILETIIGIEEERTDNTLFPNLNRLELKDLPKLSRFREVAGNSIKLPSLTQLWIDNCPNMETFIFDSLDADMPASRENFHRDIQPFFDEKVGFPSLEKMVISGMDNLESIWHNQFIGDSFPFLKLKSVEVNDCQELKTLFPTCICGRLSSLESLTVKNCGLVEEIFDLQGLNLNEKHSIEITTQLRELYVDHMSNLKRIWNKDPKGTLSYGKLQKVTVFLCPNLENLFPASVAKSLLNLISLEVSDCGLLEEIIAKGGVKEAADRLLFLKLSSLQLHNLPQLRTFYTGQTVELSCLKRLGLHHCDNVKLFFSEFLGFYETIELEGTNQGLPNLEELQLSGKPITMKWLDQVPGHAFHSLKSLELNDLESTVLPLHFIQKFSSLGKLSLNSSSYEEIFSYGEVIEHPQIKHLVLGGLFDLKQIWKQGLKIDPKFQNLEILEVRSCFNLINLMPSSASFQNLMILEVWGCDGLKNLLTSSTAKSLVLLEKLEVFDCKMLIEVVANEGAVTEEINFRKLKSLSLRYLQSLTSFCSMKHILNFPILESLVVNECPKMKIFSEGVTRTPKLHELELNWKAFEQSWEVGVNTTIEQNMEKRLKGNARNMKMDGGSKQGSRNEGRDGGT